MKHLKNWKPSKRVDGKGSRSNQERADAGENSLIAYAEFKEEKEVLAPEELSGSLSDLVADLFHYAASLGHDPEVISKTALMHFESER